MAFAEAVKYFGIELICTKSIELLVQLDVHIKTHPAAPLTVGTVRTRGASLAPASSFTAPSLRLKKEPLSRLMLSRARLTS